MTSRRPLVSQNNETAGMLVFQQTNCVKVGPFSSIKRSSVSVYLYSWLPRE